MVFQSLPFPLNIISAVHACTFKLPCVVVRGRVGMRANVHV